MAARAKTTPSSTAGSFAPSTGRTSRTIPTLPTPTQEQIDAVRSGCDMDFCAAEGHMFCSPDHAEPIAAYSLQVNASHETRDGAAWVGTIYRDNQPVLAVDNSGTGGPNSYHPPHGGDRDAYRSELDKFNNACAAAAPRLDYEQADIVVGFLDNIANS